MADARFMAGVWGALSVVCLLDALRCVWLGHADWWFPALVAAHAARRITT